MNKQLLAVKKRNGDTAIYIPVESIKNVPVVTLQKDGEIRWVSVGPLAPVDAVLFSDAVRLALHLENKGRDQIGSGLCWETKNEGE